jgi:hypothetical protein
MSNCFHDEVIIKDGAESDDHVFYTTENQRNTCPVVRQEATTQIRLNRMNVCMNLIRMMMSNDDRII